MKTAWTTSSRRQCGFTLLETLVALGILAVVAAGVLPLGLMATKSTENQGHLMARTTEYAQDKMEQLMALAWGDVLTNTRVFPATPTGGTGLALGGSLSMTTPVAGYVDYLDIDGNVLAGNNTNWYYQRVWQITSPRANLKQIAVRAFVRTAAAGGLGALPQSTVTSYKTFPF